MADETRQTCDRIHHGFRKVKNGSSSFQMKVQRLRFGMSFSFHERSPSMLTSTFKKDAQLPDHVQMAEAASKRWVYLKCKQGSTSHKIRVIA